MSVLSSRDKDTKTQKGLDILHQNSFREELEFTPHLPSLQSPCSFYSRHTAFPEYFLELALTSQGKSQELKWVVREVHPPL